MGYTYLQNPKLDIRLIFQLVSYFQMSPISIYLYWHLFEAPTELTSDATLAVICGPFDFVKIDSSYYYLSAVVV